MIGCADEFNHNLGATGRAVGVVAVVRRSELRGSIPARPNGWLKRSIYNFPTSLVIWWATEGQRMTYIVTHGGLHHGPVGLDPGLTLEQALAMAGHLLWERKPNVAIQDGNGRSISGDDLVACCKGEKNLTPDLRAE